MNRLHLDIETYSSLDLKTVGAFKYCNSLDFDILMAAYAIDDQPVQIIDLAQGEPWPPEVLQALKNPAVKKHAHNAAFERTALNAVGIGTEPEAWRCTMVKAAYCGLPLSLDQLSKILKLQDKGKLSSGKQLIKYFCVPVKPTKVNGGRVRNFPSHDPEKWEEFKMYCVNDVEAERAIDELLRGYELPDTELSIYALDQKINDRGVLVDTVLAEAAIKVDRINSAILFENMKKLTGLDNPNSPAQLKTWLGESMQREVNTIAKDAVVELQEEAGPGTVYDVLDLRLRLSKTSIKKYDSAINCAADDQRVRGLFQFYGANRTGRWAGRLVQMQNLKRNYLKDLDVARNIIRSGNFEDITLIYDNVQDVLSQLIRTVFVASPGHTLAVADFSAIEARVLAWLAGEEWRLEVFKTHGKIYEASASRMFGVPLESIDKGSEYRAKGKIAELALGYQGALGALHQMGGADMGLSDDEMLRIVKAWRAKNPRIKSFWKNCEEAAVSAITSGQPVTLTNFKNLIFDYDGKVMTIQLPSGRRLFYQEPTTYTGNYNKTAVKYKGMDQTTKKWGYIKSYGGKFVENITQAVARDILVDSMLRLDAAKFPMVMHVHDEVAAEVPEKNAAISLEKMEYIMSQPIDWAPGLILGADGYLTNYYKKD